MTAKGITARGYRYYRRNIAAGDGVQGGQPTASSSVPGVPPGVWHGQAARELGLSGVVSEEQMQALFGLGMHPGAKQIAARALAQGAPLKQALKAAKLGPAVPRLSELSPLDREIEQVLEYVAEQLCRPLTKAEVRQVRHRTAALAFEAEYHRAPADGAELGRYLAARTGPQRQALTGWDLTLSNEEASLLAALGGPEVRRVILEEILPQARAETIRWVEHHALAVRSGARGIVQERAQPGVLATVYLHYESRAGDPMFHEHVVISPRVRGPDGRWRNLDSRLLLREVVAASELFNQRVLELLCARLGLATEPAVATPGQRPVMRIAGIDARLRAEFSQRGARVRSTAEALFDDYRRRHGRQPHGPARYRLLERARSATRPGKGKARSLDELVASWRRRAIAATGQATVDQLLATCQAAAQRLRSDTVDDGGVDVAQAAEEVLAAVAERRTTFRRRHVLAEARRYLMRTLAGATAPASLADQITDRVLAHADCLDITPPEINPPHPDLQRADGTSIYRPIGSDTYTTHTLLAAENRLLAGARTLVIPPVGRGTFHRVAALHRGPMDPGQRALASSFVVSEQLLLAGLGPAGAGKTTAMRLVARAVDAAGSRLIPLAPSSRAAQVLGDDLRLRAHTLHSWLHQRDRHRAGKEVGKEFRLRPGDVVVVDEAGMAGTLLLDRVLADANAAGAVVRLLGDPHQLAAVEAGGALRLIARAGGAVELDRLHRFRTDGEAEASLVLRDTDDPRQAFTWYREQGRIVAGTYEAMCEAVFTAWANDISKGRTSLMTAADNATTSVLNQRAQAWHIAAGTVDTRRATALRTGQVAHVGDVIVTRLNRRRMTLRGGRDFVKNGDTWQVLKILPGGDVVVRHTQHRGRIRLPAAYVAGQCELGYASTIHRAQGMTVDTSHALASVRSGREGVYVQLTRGARTNRLYVAIDDGDVLGDVLAAIAARRAAHLSATETIAALQRQISAPGQLAAEFTDVAQRATAARLTGVIEDALGVNAAAMFMAADAYPSLIRALADAERAGFDLARLLERTARPRGFADADDPAAVLTWRLREHLADAARATETARTSALARLSLTQLQALARLAATQRTAALEELKAADAAVTHLPAPVTTRTGRTHPAWPERPLGPLTRTALAAQLATVREQIRHAQDSRIPLTEAARATIAALTHEAALRRNLPWRVRAREDYQREKSPSRPPTSHRPLAVVREAEGLRRTATAHRGRLAKARLNRAQTVADKIAAELRLRERLPDHLPYRPNHRGEIPAWVADRHALTHPATPEHWRTHLAERHRILTRSLQERGHTLAAAAPAWAHPLGPPPPTSAPNRRAAWAITCALVELWRTRHGITGVPGLGPRPADPDDAAAWDDLDARVRALTGQRRPLPFVLPPDAPPAQVLQAALTHLDTPPPSGALPDHPAVRDPHGVAPLTYAAGDARLARRALCAVLAGQRAPEDWIDEITPPSEDDESEQRTFLRLVTTLSDYRRRHHRAGPDVLGPRPQGLDSEEWDHLTDAIDLYTRARIERRLEQIRERTAATRAALLSRESPSREQPDTDIPQTGPRPPTR